MNYSITMRNLFLLLGGLFLLNSCTNSKQLSAESESSSNFEIIFQSEYAGTGVDESIVFTNQKDFVDFWTTQIFQPIEEIPTYDFKKKMVIAKSFESQRTGGSVYSIQKVETKGNTIFVDYTITTSGDIVTQAITNPLVVILVDKVESPKVKFELK